MRIRAVFDRINPLAGVAGMMVIGTLLVTTIFFTLFDLPWIAFLTGMLSAGAIGLVSRLAYAETALAEVRESVRYIDDELPVMIVYVTTDGTVRFHNQAFRYWLRARRDSINGRPLRSVVGLTTFGQMKAGIDSALAGRAKHETRIHEGLGSPESRLSTQYLPHVGAKGEIVGAFVVQTDISSVEAPSVATPASVAAPPPDTVPGTASEIPPSSPPAPNGAEHERRIFLNTMTEELTDWKNAGDRLRAALDGNEFSLYTQAIVPVAAGAQGEPYYEILLRLREEEEGLMPPGAFLPLAEEYGLLPDLDRWVVKNVLDWAGASPRRQAATYSLNVSGPTIGNADFPDFVVAALHQRGLKGSLLCFEITESDAVARPRDTVRFISVIGEAGCRTALCGFGQNADSFALLKRLRVDVLKIDGDIILGLLRNSVDLIKLKAITRVARATNRLTIAEFVENEETLAKLREYGVDFAQGFGISRPVPLSDLP
ncbi:MAG TPA: EAL domain-containing protein [Usitatibacteraceae bacterium]|nr:EAL domain-containing protein [Usitatibacteraceae bacterium]